MPPKDLDESQPSAELLEAQARLTAVEEHIHRVRQDLNRALQLADLEAQTPAQYYEWQRLTTARLATLQDSHLRRCLLTKKIQELSE